MADDAKLKTGTWGLIGVTALGAVMMSPALGIFGNFGPMALTSGNATPLIFLIALIVTLPTAISYAMVSKELPSSGSAYTWMWEATNPLIGIWIGWLLFGFFIVVVFLQPLLFGLFFNDLLRLLGMEAGFGHFIASMVFGSLIIAFFAYRGGNISEKGSMADLIFQMIIVLALAVTIVISIGLKDHFNSRIVLNSSSKEDFNGISQALIFGVLSFTGFNVIANMAEETKNPKKTIPRAIVLSCVIVGLYWILVSWAYLIAVPLNEITAAVRADSIPVVLIAKKFWGAGDIIIIVTGMIASLGVYLATILGSSRVMYAMARDGVITRSFGRINARYQTPWNSLHLIFILTFIFVLLPSAIFGIYFTYMWWGKAVVFFAIVIYIFVSIANPLFYYRFKRNDFSFFWNGVMGFISLIVNLYLLFKAFLVDSWRNDWLNGKSVVVFAVLWMITGFMYVFYLRRRNPDLFFKKPIYFDTNNSK